MLIQWCTGVWMYQVCRESACFCFTLQPLKLSGAESIVGKPGKLCVYVDMQGQQTLNTSSELLLGK